MDFQNGPRPLSSHIGTDVNDATLVELFRYEHKTGHCALDVATDEEVVKIQRAVLVLIAELDLKKKGLEPLDDETVDKLADEYSSKLSDVLTVLFEPMTERLLTRFGLKATDVNESEKKYIVGKSISHFVEVMTLHEERQTMQDIFAMASGLKA